MLAAVKRIGEFAIETNIDTTADKPKNKEEKVIFINLLQANPFQIEIEIEDFDKSKANLYLWDENVKKGNASLPFCRTNDPAHSLESKIEIWLKNFLKENPNFKNRTILDAFFSNFDKVRVELNNRAKDLNFNKVNYFLGFKINGEYAGNDVEIKEFWNKSREVKDWYNGTCSVCGENTLVTARTGAFQFDTDDKPGFIAGGFDKNFSWRNIPVCKDCRDKLIFGKKFIENFLQFRFYGLSYWLIPKFFVENKERIDDTLKILSDKSRIRNITLERLKFATDEENRIEGMVKNALNENDANSLLNSLLITNDENEPFHYLKVQKDFLAVNLMFIRKMQGAERILLLIEDILPSRLRKIYEKKNSVETKFNKFLFAKNELDNKEEKKSIWENYNKNFNFSKIRTFFSKSDENKSNNDLDKYFLEITDSVFKGKPIDRNFLFKFFMNTISNAFVKDVYFRYRVTDAMMVTNFFEELGIINYSKEVYMDTSSFKELFDYYGKSLNTPAKRGIFLLGALTQILLNVQYQMRGSASFMKKLKGLRMDEQDIRGLLPEVQNKFIEYDRFDYGKRQLAKIISDFFLQSGDTWKLGTDEINFYFACGMNLYDKVSEILYNNLKQKEEYNNGNNS